MHADFLRNKWINKHINKRKKAKNVMLGCIQAMNLNSKEVFNIFYFLIYI